MQYVDNFRSMWLQEQENGSLKQRVVRGHFGYFQQVSCNLTAPHEGRLLYQTWPGRLRESGALGRVAYPVAGEAGRVLTPFCDATDLAVQAVVDGSCVLFSCCVIDVM
jgi:hypothetical protein